MNSGEREMNLVAVSITRSQKKISLTLDKTSDLLFSKSCMLVTALQGFKLSHELYLLCFYSLYAGLYIFIINMKILKFSFFCTVRDDKT